MRWLDGWEFQLMIGCFVIAESTLISGKKGFIGSTLGTIAGFIYTRAVCYYLEKKK